MQARLLPFALALIAACSNAPSVSTPKRDASARDAHEDAAIVHDDAAADRDDAALEPDAGPPEDSGTLQDSGAPDGAGIVEDAGTADPCTFNAIAPISQVLDPRAALPAARLTQLETCATMRPAEATAFTDAFLAELTALGSDAPPYDAATNTALVLFRGDASNLTVSGSFDNWPNPGTRAFRNIANTDLHVAQIPIAAGARHEYKLTRAPSQGQVEWFTDPINRWVKWDGFNQGGVGNFNNELFGPTHNPGTSLIHRFFVRDRDVFLQLPVAYFTGVVTLGVLYVHDGNEMLTRSGMQAVVDQTIAAGRAAPVALAYVALPSQEVRFDEYTYGTASARGDQYITMLVDEVVPAIEPHLSLASMPDNRGLAGASLGGLISFYGAWTRNDQFHLVGAQSPSLFWEEEDMIDRVTNGPMMTARVYLDSGFPGDNSGVTRSMTDALAARGYDHLHIEENGAAHDWAFWAGRFDELVEFLY